VKWHWVKGHAGHPENERADELARQGMAPFKTQRAPKVSAAKLDPIRAAAAAKPAEPTRKLNRTFIRED
jgi:ribonuclease HI